MKSSNIFAILEVTEVTYTSKVLEFHILLMESFFVRIRCKKCRPFHDPQIRDISIPWKKDLGGWIVKNSKWTLYLDTSAPVLKVKSDKNTSEIEKRSIYIKMKIVLYCLIKIVKIFVKMPFFKQQTNSRNDLTT